MTTGTRLGAREIRKTLIFDLLCEAVVFLAALYMRYVFLENLYSNRNYDFDLYRVLFILLIVAYFIFFYAIKGNSMKKSHESPFFATSSLLKTQISMLVSVIVMLYFIRRASKVSRSVMGFIFVFGTVLCLCHRCAGFMIRKRRGKVLGRSGSKLSDRQVYLMDTAGYDGEEIKRLKGGEKELRFRISLAGLGIGKEMIEGGRTGAACISYSFLQDRAKVLGLSYAVTNVAEAVFHVMLFRKELSGQYICFSNAHTAVIGKEDRDYRDVQEKAAIVFPDGSSIAAELRDRGFGRAMQVAGPDFMDAAFRMGLEAGITHFFYGSTEETLRALGHRLEERYPGIRIGGMISPPFRELNREEDEKFIQDINSSGADFVWVGLGAPKQENWMRSHKGLVRGVLLGVGAGFDFHAGTVARAPGWVQEIGMEWLYRLFQDPGRLVGRYLVTNSKFLWYTKVLKL